MTQSSNPAAPPLLSVPAIPGLTPKQIVEELDKYIIGQDEAKKAVAIALRNRARRRMLDPVMQEEVYPKNIIMIGPTGVGKTEIARRLAKLEDAPFIKVEASKFTEVGYVGRDVESMIRDLTEIAVTRERARKTEECREAAERAAEERLLDLLVPPNLVRSTDLSPEGGMTPQERLHATRERFRQMLREGALEDRMVEPEITERAANVMVGVPAGTGLEEMGIDLKDMIEKMMPTKRKRKKMKVAEARPHLLQEEAERLVDMDQIVKDALQKVEQTGIVFLDEIDKIVGRESGSGPDVSRSGVQRDILPLVEGSTVFTKYGMVKTDHILFIAAGAFHGSSPADLIPELQGRFPIRVELDDLDEEDFKRILSEPQNSLPRQYAALLKTEGVTLEFTEDGIAEMARMAAYINSETENIGARRLHTIMESLLEEVSFNAPDLAGTRVVIDAQYVKDRLSGIVEDTDLSRYIL
ncbi:MAG TPA: ATP-dependent protease ATPase subunit HslU [bacterium]|nr:ATP-dependent protease ATPase subunit HslU [bacterium]HOL93924.1 ATP-dependent protease ATPase subunit HslU [bacterium]HPP00320.1 ATP-dependent protease ATPase subunit HslU [bacterium]HXK92398.1 ATP-dependent protease ATPase subunit HslU [bacterium]